VSQSITESPQPRSSTAPARRYDLDWLRVLGTLAVFVYHTTMFLNEWEWHIKNTIPSRGFSLVSLFESTWLMPLFFLISGIGTYYALGFRAGGAFLKERLARLGVPLLLGIFLLSPPQVFIERLTKGQFSGSFWQWLPHYFEGFYGITGHLANFAWMGLHLWYVLLLLLFSVLTLPLLRLARQPGVQRLAHGLGGAASVPGVILLFAVPAILLEVFLDYNGVLGTRALGGWNIWAYLILFLYGCFLFAAPSFQTAVRRQGPLMLALAVLSSATMLIGYVAFPSTPWGLTLPYIASSLVRVLNSWTWLLAFFWLADRYLTRTGPFLRYAGEASMPFYVIHQPVIVALAFFLRPLAWSPLTKWLVLLPSAFAIILGLYHFLVRPFKPLRFLFGMK
jgi:peptidoglycan/LPS O-acetylase OafA/YrhL